jgi:hypothetical protein
MRAALGLLILVVTGLTLAPSAASACPSSSTSEIRLLGVDEAGTAVRYSEQWGENADETWRTFIATDANGTQVATLAIEGGTITTDDPTGYFDAFKQMSPADVHLIEAAIVRSKELTGPTRKRKLRHVKSETKCGSLEIASESGWLRVAEVGVLSYQFEDTCPPLRLEALEHPASDVVFVRVKYQLGRRPKGESYTTFEESDETLILPKTRVRAAELALQGERARIRHKVEEAIPMLEEAIRLAPEILPARSSLIRAYARAGRDWERLQNVLDAPIPEEKAAIGPAPSEELIESLAQTWREAAAREESWPWQGLQEPSLRRSF